MVVCICGNINEDIILGIDAFPAFHEKRRAEALTRSYGGSGANTCWWLSSLGTPARMMGCVGRDSAGIGALSALRDAGADTQHVKESAKATGVAVVLSCGQDKRMVKYTGANEDIALNGGEMEGCTHLHLTSVPRPVAAAAFDEARARGATVSWDPSELFFPELLDGVDILFMNEDDYRRQVRGADLSAAGKIVVMLNGGGCLITGTGRVPTIDVPLVDSTGAGDAFAAGYVHAWTQGQDPRRCGALAVACSARAIGAFGAREGFTSAQDIETLARTLD